MKKGYSLFVFTSMCLGLLLCCSARAQIWKELLDRADSLSEAANYDSAIVIAEIALKKAELQFGDSDTTVALVLHRMGKYRIYQANYDSAQSLTKRALAIREKRLGLEHPDVAVSLNNLAIIYGHQGRYMEAESYYRRALAIEEKSLGPNHPYVAASLNGLAGVFWTQGKYAETEPIYNRVRTIWEKAFGSDHPYVAYSLNNLAIVYVDQGRYVEAEPLYKRALAILDKTLTPNHPKVAGTLNNLALLYKYQGKYAEAESFYKRALVAWEKTIGVDHPDIALSLHNLADLYFDQGRYTEAESLYKRAVIIREKTFASDPYIALSLDNLANVYLEKGDYAEAETLQKRALVIREKTLRLGHPDVAASLYNMANLYYRKGEHAEAESLFKQALAIMEKPLGLNHPREAEVLSNWALLLRDMEQLADSRTKGRRSFSIRRRNFRDGSAVLSEKDALTYSRFMRDEANQYISILLDSKDTSSSCRKEIAEVVFSTKGQVSDGIFARHKIQSFEKDTSLKPLSDSLRYAKFRLSNLYVQGPEEKDLEGYKEKLRQTTGEKERLEAELARQSADFRRELELWEINVDKVIGALPAKSVLVEYMKYDRLKTTRETQPHYLLVVVDTKGEIFTSDLGRLYQIDSLVTIYRSHFQEVSKRGASPFARDLENYKSIAERLYERIWKPVEKKLGDAGLVLIAPDGALNLVSFAGLTDGAGKYLIESHPIQYLSSGRDLIRLKEVVKQGNGLFALGDPEFDASPLARVSSTATLAQVQESTVTDYTLRNVRSGCDELSQITVLPLPGTRKEIDKISNAWNAKIKEPAWVFLGVNASEENFKKNAPGKKIIHLATHGYYAQSLCVKEPSQKKHRMLETFVGENPLLLSGLFLAGANLHGEGAESLGVEDGILTAEEVTSMDLDGTRWVILSACESGLGEVKSGEGVYGLRRAFQMAGARTVISALWPVSDKNTAEMMSYLYKFEEENLASAMQGLAKKKLAELRKRDQPDHPCLWAAFIALGDWR